MRISVEISLYPLHASFGTTILEFIHRLKKNEKIQIRTNHLSTQITGPYDQVMNILSDELKPTFLQEEDVVVVMKMYNHSVELDWIN